MKINRSISIDEDLWRDSTEAAARLERSFSWLVSEALRRLAAPPTRANSGPTPGFAERALATDLPAIPTPMLDRKRPEPASFGASRPAPKPGGKR